MRPPRPGAGLALAVAARATSRASSGRASPALAFSSSAARPKTRIPPESPLYLNVPNPPLGQESESGRPPAHLLKGHLPIPRPVFKQRRKTLAVMPKLSLGFLATSAPAPDPARSHAGVSELVAWQRLQAADRRANLATGLRGLWRRQRQTDSRREERQKRRLARNAAATAAPEHESDLLTAATVPAALLRVAVPLDPRRFVRAKDSQKRTARIAHHKGQLRVDALQQLYVNAENFIVDEKALEEEVDKQFSEGRFRSEGRFAFARSREMRGCSIWDQEGEPATVADMLRRNTSDQTLKGVIDRPDAVTTGYRLKRIAGELTGGTL